MTLLGKRTLPSVYYSLLAIEESLSLVIGLSEGHQSPYLLRTPGFRVRNLDYDDLLTMEVLPGVLQMIGFTDDHAVVGEQGSSSRI